jgi:hypothetical protein
MQEAAGMARIYPLDSSRCGRHSRIQQQSPGPGEATNEDQQCKQRAKSKKQKAKSKKPSMMMLGFLGWGNSLTMSYFHTGTRTIIGAEAFHCPVRDGKEWDHLAMVIRHNLLPS